MTTKSTTKTKTSDNKRAAKGSISVSTDKNSLRIQFPRSLSKTLWNKSQKYLALGLEDTPENREKAEEIALRIELDINANKLDKNLKNYLPDARLTNEIGIDYDPHKITIPLLELYDEYCEYIKPKLSYTTYRHWYINNFRKALAECPQDLSKGTEISKKLISIRTGCQTGRILDTLYNVVEWAKDTGKISPEAKNIFRNLKKYIDTKPSQPKKIKLLEDIEGYSQDDDYTAFSRQESEYIIAEFLNLGKKKAKLMYLHNLVCFLFWTGCRTGEATGLTWNNVAPDCSYVIFSQTYDGMYEKKNKPLKTAKNGAFSRKFPCGTKLKELLEELKAKPHDPKGFVFTNSRGNPVCHGSLLEKWMGSTQKNKMGVVTQLVVDGKVRQYLKPYATRHSWITLQLEEKIPVKNVAKLAGNSPKIIFKHYESPRENVVLAPEV